MAITFKNYNRGNATIQDALDTWKNDQLPDDVLEYFKNDISDITIRSLHQSNFKLYKSGLVIDTTIDFDPLLLVVSTLGTSYRVVLYQYDKNKYLETRHKETMFVRSKSDLLTMLKLLLTKHYLK